MVRYRACVPIPVSLLCHSNYGMFVVTVGLMTVGHGYKRSSLSPVLWGVPLSCGRGGAPVLWGVPLSCGVCAPVLWGVPLSCGCVPLSCEGCGQGQVIACVRPRALRWTDRPGP